MVSVGIVGFVVLLVDAIVRRSVLVVSHVFIHVPIVLDLLSM